MALGPRSSVKGKTGRFNTLTPNSPPVIHCVDDEELVDERLNHEIGPGLEREL